MPDMDSVYRDRPGGRRSIVRLAVALGLVFAGAAVLATGLAGVVSSLSDTAGSQVVAAVAAVLVPATLAAVQAAVPADRPLRVAGASGAGLALLGVLVAWVTGAPTPAWAPLPVPAMVGAVVGTALAAGALVTAAATEDGERTGTGYAMPGRVSSPRPGPGAGLPADGGRDDDEDLSFPLDDEQ